MRHVLLAAAVTLWLVPVVIAQPVQLQVQLEPAGAPAPRAWLGPTLANRVLPSAAVVSGKVTAVDSKGLELAPYPNAPFKARYKVATIQVESVLVGDAKLKEVKVALEPTYPTGLLVGPPQLRAVMPVQLIAGQEGVFFLSPFALADGHFTILHGFTPLNPDDTNYKTELDEVKKLAVVANDPVAALKSDKPDQRLLAAATLVSRYRTYPQGVAQIDQVAIPAEESKLILKALNDADWEVKPNADYQTNASTLAGQLGLTPGQNGFPQINVRPGTDFNKLMGETYKEWFKENGEKYQIKKFVKKK